MAVEVATLVEVPFTVFYGDAIHTPLLGALEVMADAYIGVDSTGTIQFISTKALYHDELAKLSLPTVSVPLVPAGKGFFFPGFIDTHIHAPQYPNAGIFGETTLFDWLTTYTFPLEAALSDLALASVVYQKVVDRTLANGTTFAAYYATLDPNATNLLADICLSSGQRALIGRVCMDQNSPEFYVETLEQAQVSTATVIQHIKDRDPTGLLIQPVLTPRFAPSCTSAMMAWLGNLRKETNLPCQTHLSENVGEVEWVKALFPKSDSYTGVYDDHGLLSNKTILAHSIHLSNKERDLIAERGCGVAHCPVSNSSLTSGEARVRWMLKAGIPVGLGTDVSGGFSPSILASARHALLVSRHLAMKGDANAKLTVKEVLYLATMGGAQVCSVEGQVGSFAVGKKWDAQLVDLTVENSPVDVFEWQAPGGSDVGTVLSEATRYDNLVAKWLFNGDDRNTTAVWVNGRCVRSL